MQGSGILEHLRAQESVLDQLQDGVLVVDGGLRVQHANARARMMLQRADAIRSDDGCVCCVDADSQSELLRIVAGGPRNSAGGWLAVPQAGARPLLAEVIALGARNGGGGSAAATFAIRIRNPARARVPTALHLQKLFGLTLGEAKAVLAIVQTPGQLAAAHRLGRSVATLRTHLHHAYAKMGVHDPADLARLLAAYGFVQSPEVP
jgi:DNA-binding CsgD family transcriptional regulator